MTQERRSVLAGVGIFIALAAAFILSHVLATVVVAVAAAYMLLPLHRWLVKHGLPAYWSAIATSLLGVVASLALISPFVFVLYLRRRTLIDVITSLDGSLLVTIGNEHIRLDLTAVQEAITPNISRLAVFIGQQLSVISAKFIVYGFVVFALLYYHRDLRSLVFGPIPASYHGVIDTIHVRIREMFFGHYVLVIVGGVTTYIAGLGVFIVLGYSVPYALALFGAVLWVLPFVSAAPLVFGLSAFHILQTEFLLGLSVAGLGAVFLVALPTLVVDVVRTRLDNPQRLSQTLYFVGFVGGGLTVGIVGLIAGPLALTVLTTLFTELGNMTERSADEELL